MDEFGDGKLSNKEFRKIFKEFDTDGSGTIEKEEMAAFVK